MAVVVMAYEAPFSLIAAVHSILGQDSDSEIVVVNSGGGDVHRLLAAAGINVKVIESSRRLLPGGTRNLGINSTKARFVAFLASDCTAEAGWIAERLRAHHEGHAAVASALICHRPRNPIALAAHLSLFFRRMPRTPPDIALAYGGSYARQLFATYGLFREDMRGGEDTEFHLRLAPCERPKWRPEVQTVHFGSSSLVQFVTDQFHRGRRSAEAWYAINQLNRRSFAWGVLKRIQWVIQMSLKVVEPVDRPFAVLALPLICIGGIVYTFGALSATTDATAHGCRD
jgi:glycosyltransferase involved in cell wall biosynthesis